MRSDYHLALGVLMVTAILNGADTREAIAASIRETLAPLDISDLDLENAAQLVHDTIERSEQADAHAKTGAS